MFEPDEAVWAGSWNRCNALYQTNNGAAKVTLRFFERGIYSAQEIYKVSGWFDTFVHLNVEAA